MAGTGGGRAGARGAHLGRRLGGGTRRASDAGLGEARPWSAALAEAPVDPARVVGGR